MVNDVNEPRNVALLSGINKNVYVSAHKQIIDQYVDMAKAAKTPKARLDLLKNKFGNNKVKSSELETQLIKFIVEQFKEPDDFWELDNRLLGAFNTPLSLLSYMASEPRAIDQMAKWETWWEFSTLYYILNDSNELKSYSKNMNRIFNTYKINMKEDDVDLINNQLTRFASFKIDDNTTFSDLLEVIHNIPIFFKICLGY